MSASHTSAAGETQSASAVRECRIYERHSCNVETSCQPPTLWGGQDMHWPAQIRDVSQGGLGLVLRRRFEKGAGLAIELPRPDGGEASTVLVRVVRVSAQPDGSWLLGCRFISSLSEEEVEALTHGPHPAPEKEAIPAKPPVPDEPSMAAVLPSQPDRMLIRGVQLEGVLADGRIMRRWMHRLYLPHGWPVARGNRFLLRTNRGRAGKAGIRLQVESCTPQGQHWVLRCRFLQADPKQAAAALGVSVSGHA